MFRDHGRAFAFDPAAVNDMVRIQSVDDRNACVARLRRIMEDPTQLLSNCVADYVVEELRRHGNDPRKVAIPGFTNYFFNVEHQREM